MDQQPRIVSNHSNGEPIIRGTTVTVSALLGLLFNGRSVDEVRQLHPNLSEEDIYAALDYAAEAVKKVDLNGSFSH